MEGTAGARSSRRASGVLQYRRVIHRGQSRSVSC
jgi:hypothetical protein